MLINHIITGNLAKEQTFPIKNILKATNKKGKRKEGKVRNTEKIFFCSFAIAYDVDTAIFSPEYVIESMTVDPCQHYSDFGLSVRINKFSLS